MLQKPEKHPFYRTFTRRVLSRLNYFKFVGKLLCPLLEQCEKRISAMKGSMFFGGLREEITIGDKLDPDNIGITLIVWLLRRRLDNR